MDMGVEGPAIAAVYHQGCGGWPGTGTNPTTVKVRRSERRRMQELIRSALRPAPRINTRCFSTSEWNSRTQASRTTRMPPAPIASEIASTPRPR